MSATSPANNSNEEAFDIPLPIRGEGLEALTRHLMSKTGLVEVPDVRITHVVPRTVSACDQTASMVIHGTGLWRSPDAFLNGVRHQSLRVLPDMAGLAVAFNTGGRLPAVPGSRGDKYAAVVVVYTSVGEAQYTLDLTDEENGRCKQGVETPLRVQAKGNVFTVGQPIALKVTEGSLQKLGFSRLTVRVRPFVRGVPFEFEPRDTIDARLDVDQTTITKIVIPTSKEGFVDGNEVEVALVLTPRPGAAEEIRVSDHRLVYYSSEDAAKAILVTREIADIDSRIAVKLMLPANWVRAYPAQLAGQGKTAINLIAKGLVLNEGSRDLSIALNFASDADRRAYEEAHKAGDLQFKMFFDNSQREMVPAINGDLKVRRLVSPSR
jgi:hypothetical protein